jgi:hypothetical protein
MKKGWILLFILLLVAVPWGVQGLVTRSGDQVVLREETDDDVVVSGGLVQLDAPVGSLMAAGGSVVVNAPVRGDVVAAGGSIHINAPVGGKVFLAGGTVVINATIARNALVYAGNVEITPESVIGGDAVISGGTVTHRGEVRGTLSVSSQEFSRTGGAGTVHFVPTHERPGTLGGMFSLALLFFSIGLMVLGLVLIRVAPGPFFSTVKMVREQPLVKGVVGLAGILGGIVLVVLLAVTIIGLPIALLGIFGWCCGLLLSTLFVSAALGQALAGGMNWNLREWQVFIIGFVILQLLFRVPYLGLVILAAAACLGFGALIYAAAACRPLLAEPMKHTL